MRNKEVTNSGNGYAAVLLLATNSNVWFLPGILYAY